MICRRRWRVESISFTFLEPRRVWFVRWAIGKQNVKRIYPLTQSSLGRLLRVLNYKPIFGDVLNER